MALCCVYKQQIRYTTAFFVYFNSIASMFFSLTRPDYQFTSFFVLFFVQLIAAGINIWCKLLFIQRIFIYFSSGLTCIVFVILSGNSDWRITCYVSLFYLFILSLTSLELLINEPIVNQEIDIETGLEYDGEVGITTQVILVNNVDKETVLGVRCS
jgi:hypothetical protein